MFGFCNSTVGTFDKVFGSNGTCLSNSLTVFTSALLVIWFLSGNLFELFVRFLSEFLFIIDALNIS